ncbi:hypothetical protein [Salinimicrobium flavum]|uniref:Sperm nuclear basic protein PL-I n=1 Tax=Salinimicrobium flavum TaxID=1737065 RepID=A0ABW5IZB9_9FLAO
MKNIYLFFAFLMVGFTVQAATAIDDRRGYQDAFIFMERGIEFAVYPDGQFDFFYDGRRGSFPMNMSSRNMNFSFNSGYNYDPYVQYDDFGAVIQIENVPVYYDFYGRIVQAGRVQLSYNHFGMLSRVGNLFLHYNPYNRFTHYSGYINAHNRFYVYRPWHDYYSRPHAGNVVVYHQPYRAYYEPYRVKYSHHKQYYKKNYSKNYRRSYYSPGEQVASYHRGTRTTAQRDVDYSQAPVTTTRSNVNTSNRSTVTQKRQVRDISGNRAQVQNRSRVQDTRTEVQTPVQRTTRSTPQVQRRSETPSQRVTRAPQQVQRNENPAVRTSRSAPARQTESTQSVQTKREAQPTPVGNTRNNSRDPEAVSSRSSRGRQ